MQYQEKKTDTGYHYYSAGVFGDMEVEALSPVTADQLDGMLSLFMKDKSSAQILRGSIKLSETQSVMYTFTKNLNWGEQKVNVPKPPPPPVFKETRRAYLWRKTYNFFLHIVWEVKYFCTKVYDFFTDY